MRKAASPSATAALEFGVIEIVALNLDALVTAADGRSVNLGGKTVVLHTANLKIVEAPPNWRSEFLGILANPVLAYMQMLSEMASVQAHQSRHRDPGSGDHRQEPDVSSRHRSGHPSRLWAAETRGMTNRS